MSTIISIRAVACAMLVGSALFSLAPDGQAANIDTNTTIDAENSFPDEGVAVLDGDNPPTIVDILPGAIIGSVDSFSSGLSAFDTSIVTIFGGAITGFLSVDENATMNLVDLDPGTAVDGVRAFGDATFNMSGGEIGDQGVKVVEDSPTLNISGGVIMNALSTQSGASATINRTGGEIVGSFRIRGSTTAHWWGGATATASVWDDAQLHVYGFDLAIGDDRLERLTGRLADGTPVDFQPLIRGNGTATIHLHEVTDTPGDSFPLDGAVDIDDLNRVRNHFGQGQMGGDPVPGDTFPFDGIVDVNDLNRIRNHFGRTGPPTPVPEPMTGVMLLLGMAVILAVLRLRGGNA